MDIGIKEQDRKNIAQGLSHLLADTYTLYLKTHYFHWNVTGPMFSIMARPKPNNCLNATQFA